MFNYNIFHHKNVNIQKRLINRRDYTYQSLLKIFSKHFCLIEGKNDVLDLGCGVGTVDFYLANQGFDVVGIDISSRAIKLAKLSKREMNIPGISFYCSSLEKFHIEKKFDYIILSEVVEHLEDPISVIKRIRKVMKGKSLLVVSTPLVSAPLYRWGLLDEFDRKVGHLRRYSKEDLLNILKSEKFVIVEYFETEGLLRNLLYTHDSFGFILKFIRWPFSLLFNYFDKLTSIFFGYSNIYVICRKL